MPNVFQFSDLLWSIEHRQCIFSACGSRADLTPTIIFAPGPAPNSRQTLNIRLRRMHIHHAGSRIDLRPNDPPGLALLYLASFCCAFLPC
jgi:hypothetical protein